MSKMQLTEVRFIHHPRFGGGSWMAIVEGQQEIIMTDRVTKDMTFWEVIHAIEEQIDLDAMVPLPSVYCLVPSHAACQCRCDYCQTGTLKNLDGTWKKD